MGGTGAGDAFDAGYILGLAGGDEPRRCLEWGSALGASCVRSISATASVFTRAEAEAFIQKASAGDSRVLSWIDALFMRCHWPCLAGVFRHSHWQASVHTTAWHAPGRRWHSLAEVIRREPAASAMS